jgi:FkbM family methyltransferase
MPPRALNPEDLIDRVRITLMGRDADNLPRAAHAGLVGENSGTPVQVMHNGLIVVRDGYYGQWMTDLIKYMKGVHEPQEEFAFSEILPYAPPNSTIIELGAYWGFYSMWFLKSVSASKAYLFEPEIQHLMIGMKNLQLNGLSGQFFHGAIGPDDGARHLSLPGLSSTVNAPIVTVDEIMEQQRIQFAFMIHSDIQGAELNMLKGAYRSMAEKRIGYFFISTHDDKALHHQCIALLQEFDFSILAEHSMQESFSVDGLIVAKAPHMDGPKIIPISKRLE